MQRISAMTPAATAPSRSADGAAAVVPRTRSSGAALAGWLMLTVGGGTAIGLLSNGGDGAWFQALRKPTWNPPNWVFAPVWTTLYVGMGVAAWLVWRDGGWARQRRALTLFLTQLALNFAWSPIFFNAHQPGWALLDLTALWAALALTIGRFATVRRAAAWLLVPYLAWVTFAASLNAWIVGAN